MKQRPILFSGPMVTAILEGRKTQTRRLVKPQPDGFIRGASGTFGVPKKITTKKPHKDGSIWKEEDGTCYDDINCPYGNEGDRLWVRETWGREYGGGFLYRASHSHMKPDGSWKPSIHMPRTVSRINLEVQSIRVERLQDITREDALSEGVYFDEGLQGYVTGKDGRNFHHSDPRISFCKLWVAINGGESWDANPYVWVVQFKQSQN